jgi:hypothetical protein
MKNLIYTPQPDDRINELRLITRSLMLLAFLTAGLYIRVFVAATLWPVDVSGEGAIGLLSFLFLVVAIAGLLLTWRWEGPGGLVVVISGIALSIATYFLPSENRWLTVFFYGSPFIITGSLNLICWHRARRQRTAVSERSVIGGKGHRL